jgi:MoxR-like ATPase
MTKTNDILPKSDWQIYLGNRKTDTAWIVPPPPPWRARHAPQALALTGPPRLPLSKAAMSNGLAYQANAEIVRMVNAAIHLRRPLLITGGPGTGKSTLVDSIAYELDLGEPLRWAVTSRSTLRDALYNYDAIGRVQHRDYKNSSDNALDIGDFIELGPLGTAMLPAMRPRILLIDEIDKADIDLPNDLLNILEDGRFHIPELSRISKKKVMVRGFGGEGKVEIEGGKVACFEFPLVILTSNGERDFPAPFLRRCLQLRMPDPCADRERLDAIVMAHLGKVKAKNSVKLVTNFMTRAEAGEVLATDQLLNAIQMVMGAYAMDEGDKSKLVACLTAGLGRKLS